MESRAQSNCLLFQENSLCIVETVHWEFWSTGNKPCKAFFTHHPLPSSGSFLSLFTLSFPFSHDNTSQISLFINLLFSHFSLLVLIEKFFSLCCLFASSSAQPLGCGEWQHVIVSHYIFLCLSCIVSAFGLIAFPRLFTPAMLCLVHTCLPIWLLFSNYQL